MKSSILFLPRIPLILAFFLTVGPPARVLAAGPACAGSLSLDGVDLTVCAPFFSELHFFTPDPTSSIQLAYALDPNDPAQEFSITAIPYGVKAGSEIFPAQNVFSDPSPAQEQLRAFRQGQGGSPRRGPVAVLFGQNVESIASQVTLPGAAAPRPALLIEWIASAGGRLWVVRIVRPVVKDPASADGLLFAGLRLDSPNLDCPSTSLPARRPDLALNGPPQTLASSSPSAGNLANLPTPAWWNGPCDTFNYYAKTGNTYYAYPLGASYLGMEACGPRHAFDEGPDVAVYFFPGAWGQLEWECVELAMRFMYLAYGIRPYAGNGNQVVQNYIGTFMEKVTNGTPGRVPLLGDVLSYCASCSVGHTSVVMASSVNGSGTGSITVIEQNNTVKGTSTLAVTAWRVTGNAGSIIGWLHPKGVSQFSQPYETYFPVVRK
ncbi:MAG TPA: CHAP domain-containing protein [Anaerolineaceae bacterium]|nr:CHAP domain-containing protein [Anaerolineaceae bacterium]